MSRPWQKQWPRVGTTGKKSYQVGFYDHERVERTKTFPSASLAREWMRAYSAAERRGVDSLRRFLLDLDAKEANAIDGRTLGEVVKLYFALDANPALVGGLAPATFAGYTSCANRHILGHPTHNRKRKVVDRAPYALELARTAAVRFNEPGGPRQWRTEMLHAGQSQSNCREAWKVLSAVLSWAAGSHLVPEIETNGCLLANERMTNRRRSARNGGNGQRSRGRRHGSQVPSWALSPQAVEAIRCQLLARVERRDPILAQRDATIVSLQYGLGARNQEVWGLRWASVTETFADIVEVISWGELNEWGKTAHSTERRCAVPSVLWEDLIRWRTQLRDWGHPARDVDFIIPGDLGGADLGIVDRYTGARHLSLNQCKKWGPKFFRPAVEKAAEDVEFANILGATPYAMRRGGISVRLRAEDAQTVAKECGTSLQMLDKHYAFAIDDLRRFGPRPFDEEWRAARSLATGSNKTGRWWRWRRRQ
jgi:integrase